MSSEWIQNMDPEGRTPLDRAYQSGHPAIAEMMLRQDRADEREALSGSTPIHRAAYLGLTGAVKSLITYGADPNVIDPQGETPLHKAVRQGHRETVSFLLRYSDPNATNSVGLTPMHWACLLGHAEIAELLAGQGGDPWVRGECMEGLAPVKIAEIMGYEDLFDLLYKRAGYG